MISSEQISDIQNRLDSLYQFLSIEGKKEEIEKLEQITQESDFWDHPDKAQKTLKEISKIKIWTSSFNKAKTELDELVILEEFLSEGESSEVEVDSQFQKCISLLEDLEFKNMLSA